MDKYKLLNDSYNKLNYLVNLSLDNKKNEIHEIKKKNDNIVFNLKNGLPNLDLNEEKAFNYILSEYFIKSSDNSILLDSIKLGSTNLFFISKNKVMLSFTQKPFNKFQQQSRNNAWLLRFK